MHSLRHSCPKPESKPQSPFQVGIRALDALLTDGILAQGQITEWVGGPASGKTAILATFARAALRRGHGVAWIDAQRMLLPSDWTAPSLGLFWVARPPLASEAVFCTEVLLRTQCFRLVVVDGAPDMRPAQAIRLQRHARQTGGSIVFLRNNAASHRVHSRVRVLSRLLPVEGPMGDRMEPVRRVEITPQRGKAQTVYLSGRRLPKLALYATVPDRGQTRTRSSSRYG